MYIIQAMTSRSKLYQRAKKLGYTEPYRTSTIVNLRNYIFGRVNVLERDPEPIIIEYTFENNDFNNIEGSNMTLDSQIQQWIAKNKPRAFQITLESRVTNLKETLKFGHPVAYNNWYKKYDGPYGVKTSDCDEDVVRSMRNIWHNPILVDIREIKGGCNNSNYKTTKPIKFSNYEFFPYYVFSKNDNCLFKAIECLLHNKLNDDTKLDIKALRKEFECKGQVEITTAVIIAKRYNIRIVDESSSDILESDILIVFKNNHYYAVDYFTIIKRKEQKTKRGLLSFDLETRPTDEFKMVGDTKSYILRPTICCVYYKPYAAGRQSDGHVIDSTYTKLVLTTNKQGTCSRQFLDFLSEEGSNGRFYNCIAHNGSAFDFYFLIQEMTKEEINDSEKVLRGLKLIGLNFRNNMFKDPCCFLTNTLEKLSDSYGIEHGKLTSITFNGITISNSQLCFYKPELSFDDFMLLEETDPNFWTNYVNYCMYDSIAISEIWYTFCKTINNVIKSIDASMLRTCNVDSCLTIGSHAKKILNRINGVNFMQNVSKYSSSYKKMSEFINKDNDKYSFLCNFKQGGISHCHQAGRHKGVSGLDICSQYPTAMTQGRVPAGPSTWTSYYDTAKYGFYMINNIKSKEGLKPVAQKSTSSLNWTSDLNDASLYVDSYMLSYLLENKYIESFDVIKGLVSDYDISMKSLFGRFVTAFFKVKQEQDTYKHKKKNYEAVHGHKIPKDQDLLNNALREVCKLYLNSLSGKMVEDPSRYYSLDSMDMFDPDIIQDKKEEIFGNDIKELNGVEFVKHYASEINNWLTTGIIIYSYSKRLLFEYIKCLPNKEESVIQIETDGIYINTKDLAQFKENVTNYSGLYNCRLGLETIDTLDIKLGDIVIEKEGSNIAYFLGKKFYCIPEFKDCTRCKGLPTKTLLPDGTKVPVYDITLYEDVYEGKTRKYYFNTLTKNLFGQTYISAHCMSRTIRPMMEYKDYTVD